MQVVDVRLITTLIAIAGTLAVVLASSAVGLGAPPADESALNADEPLWFEQAVSWTAIGIEAAGIGVLVAGLLIATFVFLRRIARQSAFDDAYSRYRADLGRAILLGLEFLVAADIIGTVAVHPSFESVGVLAIIVAIRTFLSFSLEAEIEGHWPWQASQRTDRAGQKKV